MLGVGLSPRRWQHVATLPHSDAMRQGRRGYIVRRADIVLRNTKDHLD